MALTGLQHVTVATKDLEGTKAFYCDVLGLREGFRPRARVPGYWLYCGEVPVVHLAQAGMGIGAGPSADTGPFDHVAFAAEDLPAVRAALDRRQIAYRHSHNDTLAMDQLFFRDNNGVMIELNFREG